jgi:hypothetical protein
MSGRFRFSERLRVLHCLPLSGQRLFGRAASLKVGIDPFARTTRNLS